MFILVLQIYRLTLLSIVCICELADLLSQYTIFVIIHEHTLSCEKFESPDVTLPAEVNRMTFYLQF